MSRALRLVWDSALRFAVEIACAWATDSEDTCVVLRLFSTEALTPASWVSVKASACAGERPCNSAVVKAPNAVALSEPTWVSTQGFM